MKFLCFYWASGTLLWCISIPVTTCLFRGSIAIHLYQKQARHKCCELVMASHRLRKSLLLLHLAQMLYCFTGNYLWSRMRQFLKSSIWCAHVLTLLVNFGIRRNRQTKLNCWSSFRSVSWVQRSLHHQQSVHNNMTGRSMLPLQQMLFLASITLAQRRFPTFDHQLITNFG